MLAHHCAPSLLGIKPANLISISKGSYNVHQKIDFFNRKAAGKGLKIRILCECPRRVLVLIYNITLMKKQLSEPDRMKLMEEYGYNPASSVDEILTVLAEKIVGGADFPHEIGIFLGYPVHDINGFVNNSSDVKFTGYWKVYADEERAKKLFESYTKCKSYLCTKLIEGADIYEALKIS